MTTTIKPPLYFDLLPNEIIEQIILKPSDKKTLCSCFCVFSLMKKSLFWHKKLKYDMPILGDNFMKLPFKIRVCINKVNKRTIYQHCKLLKVYPKIVKFINGEECIGFFTSDFFSPILSKYPYDKLLTPNISEALNRVSNRRDDRYEIVLRLLYDNPYINVEVIGCDTIDSGSSTLAEDKIHIDTPPIGLCTQYFMFDDNL